MLGWGCCSALHCSCDAAVLNLTPSGSWAPWAGTAYTPFSSDRTLQLPEPSSHMSWGGGLRWLRTWHQRQSSNCSKGINGSLPMGRADPLTVTLLSVTLTR